MRVLVVAGSDSGGGAGIQADIKTITMLGGYAATAVTALTAQNTLGVFGVMPVPAAFVRQQMRVVLDDIGAEVIKTGMLHDESIVEAVCLEFLATVPRPKLVVDPVMIAKGGASLLSRQAAASVLERLLPLAFLVTPNAPEAAALTGLVVSTEADLVLAGRALVEKGARAALVKGGHLEGREIVDALVTPDRVRLYRAQRVETRHNHGTGCTLASAIAALLAQGESLETAVERARAYVRRALEAAPGLGRGHGPLGHAFALATDYKTS
mgnify:CR=1 FL=1